MDKQSRKHMAGFYQALKGKSKAELWTVLEGQSRIMERDPQYRKAWLIDDIMRNQFGQRKLEQFHQR